jgi:hypothetical protein
MLISFQYWILKVFMKQVLEVKIIVVPYLRVNTQTINIFYICSLYMEIVLLLLQSALKPLVGFRFAQLSLSILSRNVLQDAVASGMSNRPTCRRTRDLERSNFRQKRPPASEATLANPAAEGGTMCEKLPRNFAESGDFHVTFGFFYMS